MSKSKKNVQGGQSLKESLQSAFASGAILVALIVAIIIFKFIMGSPSNFQGGNPAGSPLPGNFLGMIYKGGFIVPILITCVLCVLIFTIERWVMLRRARGTGRINQFVKNIQTKLAANQIDEAVAACDKQKGSVANVMKAGLKKYKELKDDTILEKDQKVLALQKEMEESTALELPMLNKNLVIL